VIQAEKRVLETVDEAVSIAGAGVRVRERGSEKKDGEERGEFFHGHACFVNAPAAPESQLQIKTRRIMDLTRRIFLKIRM
jgi:hypothetical protein